MRLLSFFVLLIVLGFVTADFTCGLKTKSITKLQNKISSYLKTSQYSKLLGYIEKDIINGVNASTTFDKFAQYLLSCFDFKQTTEVAAKGVAANNEMKGMNLSELLSQLGEGLRENLQSFVQKLVTKAKNMKAKGEIEDTILKSGYKLVYEFITNKKMETIMCSIRNRFTDQQWGVVYKNFGVCFHFDSYGCSKVN